MDCNAAGTFCDEYDTGGSGVLVTDQLLIFKEFDLQFYMRYTGTNDDSYSGHTREIFSIDDGTVNNYLPKIYINRNTLDVIQIQHRASNQGASVGMSAKQFKNVANHGWHHFRIQVFEDPQNPGSDDYYMRVFFNKVQVYLLYIGDRAETNTADLRSLTVGSTRFIHKKFKEIQYQQYLGFPSDCVITVPGDIDSVTTNSNQNMGRIHTFREYDLQFDFRYDPATIDAYSGHVRSVVHIGNHGNERIPAIYVNRNTLDTLQFQVSSSDGNSINGMVSRGISAIHFPGFGDSEWHHVRIQVFEDHKRSDEIADGADPNEVHAYIRVFYDRVMMGLWEIPVAALNDNEGNYLGQVSQNQVWDDNLRAPQGLSEYQYVGTSLWTSNPYNHPMLNHHLANLVYKPYTGFPCDSIITIPSDFDEILTNSNNHLGRIHTFRQYDLVFEWTYQEPDMSSDSGHVRSMLHIGNHELEKMPAIYINRNTLDTKGMGGDRTRTKSVSRLEKQIRYFYVFPTKNRIKSSSEHV